MHDRSQDLKVDRAGTPLARESALPRTRHAPEPRFLQLQRTHGNRFVQRAAAAWAEGGEVSGELEQRIDRARAHGSPLDRGVRSTMESAFGVDFGSVRVHTGTDADSLNRAVAARAFTTGSDVFFAEGQYAPESRDGRELIAHELTHVVQQMDGVQAKLWVSAADDAYEREADAVARSVIEHDAADSEARG